MKRILVVVAAAGGLAVCARATTISFDLVSAPAGKEPVQVAFGDFDTDGRLDLVTKNSGDNDITYMRGLGKGRFGPPRHEFGGGQAVAVADLNRDGRPDLLTEYAALINRGGTFDYLGNYSHGMEPRRLSVGDFNGDTYPDAATLSPRVAAEPGGRGRLFVHYGVGDGRFENGPTFGFDHPTAVATGDLVNSARASVVVTTQDERAPETLPGRLHVLIPRVQGGFQTPAEYPVGVDPSAVFLAEIDGSAGIDVAVANAASATVTIFRGTGFGILRRGGTYSAGLNPRALRTGDVNGDGKTDVVTAGRGARGNVSVLPGTGNGALGAPQVFDIDWGEIRGLAIADANGDHRFDIAAVGPGDDAVMLLLTKAAAQCVVPKVVGKRLRAARLIVRRAHCRVGRERRVVRPLRAGRVLAQRPRPGKRLRAGSRVDLVVAVEAPRR